ncbi:MAG TPA: hypothetical protein VGR87_05790 [Candidatus Limnocylindria bacterium]|nr:hypothetical protein [Candidatus Limnocylindria bacterium]
MKIARAGPGVVTSAPPGISCGVDCTARFATGTSLTLTATAEPGASFAEWSGDCTGTAPVCAIAVDAAKNVTARFDAPLGSAALTVSRRGPGAVTSTPPGLTCGAACSATFITGTDVTLNAVAEPGALFDGWGGDCSGTASTCTVTMSAARTATARFLLSSYALAVTRSGPGTVTSAPDGISCGTTCTATFASGSTVMLAATANATALFSGWGGACSGTAPTCTVTMDASRSVTASFAGVTNVVSITRSGPGTVTSAPAGIDCGVVCSARFVSGARVTLTAVPDAGSLFGGWSGDCVGASATCTLTVDRAINAAVRFAQSSYLLSVNKSGSGTGKVTSSPPGIDCGPTCLASFDNGTAVTLVARADAGMQFTGWSGGCSGITDSCVLTMDVPGSVTATFMRTFALTVVVRPTSGGIVVIGPAGSSCTQVCTVNFADGTPITLTARPLTGGQLVGWDGGPCSPLGAALTCQFALTASQSVIATFSNIR